MAISLTDRQLKVLRHVIIDPQDWIDTAESKVGTERAKNNLEKKVARWESTYDAAVAAGSYKDRLDREIDEETINSEKAKLQAIKDAR